MIGIIAAMPVEKDAFASLMDHPVFFDEDGLSGVIGDINGEEVCLILSGVGKISCAINATRLMERKKPHLLINIGCAGSLNKNVRVNDVVIATDVALHDVDVPGWDKSFNSEKIAWHTDEDCVTLAKQLPFDYPKHIGPMVSGDSFITHGPLCDKILKDFPEALCGEMEAGAVAAVAKAYRVPFIILRAISDVVLEQGNEIQFDEFVLSSSVRSARFCKSFIEAYHEQHR